MIEIERRSLAEELTPAFTVTGPAVPTVPFVFCSPHSGSVYPTALMMATRLDPAALRKSEDCYVDDLFAPVAALGAPLIAARFPRAYLDVNREPYELDPQLFAGPLPEFANTQSARVVGGLGTIARIVADQEEIYRERLGVDVALERIERLYFPFHRALGALLAATRDRFGVAVLVDCHSMPSGAAGSGSSQRPHFVLGDRFGGSCDARLTRQLRDALGGHGYDVHLNRPYAGGFITENYGRPSAGIHAIQIEINRALYLDEATFTRSSGFTRLQANLGRVVHSMVSELAVTATYRAAAE